MVGTPVAKRLVIHIAGYDPITPPAAAQRRLAREIQRFGKTWSLKTSVEPRNDNVDETTSIVTATGPNWQVQTDYHFLRWDDEIENYDRRAIWYRIPVGIVTFFDFVIGGALAGYLRTNWHYAVFFLYPFVVLGAVIAIAFLVGLLALHLGGSVLIGVVAGLIAFAALLAGPWRWMHLNTLFDDWIFSRAYIRYGSSIIEERLGRFAAKIVSIARGSDVDEILIVGHSLGAVLAVDMLDQALRLNPALGVSGTPVTFLTVGSSLLKVGLHRGATRFRAAAERVARAPGIFWGDYQARVDIMNFYDTDPLAEMSLPVEKPVVVRLVEFGKALEHATYRKMRLRFYRLHSQFVSGNDKQASYDYFMLVCGPVSAKSQTLADDGVLSMIGKDGVLIGPMAGHDVPLTKMAPGPR